MFTQFDSAMQNYKFMCMDPITESRQGNVFRQKTNGKNSLVNNILVCFGFFGPVALLSGFYLSITHIPLAIYMSH